MFLFIRVALPIAVSVLFVSTDLYAQTVTAEWTREEAKAFALPDGRLGRVLMRYFDEGIGGEEALSQTKSLFVEGTIQAEEISRHFRVMKKKPNLFHLRIGLPDRREWTMAFDGTVGWDRHPDRNNGEPRLMEGQELTAFKLDSTFASHLLYPLAAGKQIEFIDTVPVDGRICHEIRVTFENGWILTYFIDIRSFNEYKLVTQAPGEDEPRETVFEDFRLVNGLPLAHRVITRRSGKTLNTLIIERAVANPGVMSWMFTKPQE